LIGDICNAAMSSTISGVKRRFGFLTTLRLQGLQSCPLFLRLLNTSCKLRISKSLTRLKMPFENRYTFRDIQAEKVDGLL
jgi:hypothetical protein